MGAHDTKEVIELTDIIHDGEQHVSREHSLEDAFEHVRADTRDMTTARTGAHDDLDIESLFEELEKTENSTTASPASSPADNDAKKTEHDTSRRDQEFADLDDLFGSIDTPSASSDDQDTTASETKTGPETTAAENSREAEPVSPVTLEDLTARIITLENRSFTPEPKMLENALAAFFEENDRGRELITLVTSTAILELRETAGALIDKKLASLEILSSEEISSMITEEIGTAAREVSPPDTDLLPAGIKEELQNTLREEKEAWGEERTALSNEVASLQARQNQQENQENDIRNQLETLRADINATLAREIPAAAARIIREEIAALLKS